MQTASSVVWTSSTERYPSAPEKDNGIDDDCDGEIDEGWFDADNDGWREDEGDCDDLDAWTNPDVFEVCDGHDNNCDGVIDEGYELPCEDPDDVDVDDGAADCGCQTNGGIPNGGLALFIGALMLRRRRAAYSE